MTYSESLFQRQLLKVLNRISNELHESNVLAKESVAMQKRMMCKREEERMNNSYERYTISSKYDLEKFNAESEDNKEQ